jgi:hypothetical protein
MLIRDPAKIKQTLENDDMIFRNLTEEFKAISAAERTAYK